MMHKLLTHFLVLLLAATLLAIPGVTGARPGAPERASFEEEEEGFEAFDEMEEAVEEKVKISGYADFAFFTGGEDGEEGKSSFVNRHLYIMVELPLSDNIGFEAEIRGTYLQVEWALHEAAILLFGKILVPFGRWHHLDLGQTRGKLGPIFWAEPGVVMLGDVYPIPQLRVNYALYGVNGLSKDLNEQNLDKNDNKAIGGRVALGPIARLEVAASGYSGKWSSDDEETLLLWGVDGMYSFGPLALFGEYAEAQIDDGDEEYGKSAFYVQGSYKFLRKFKGVVRYSEYEDDDRVTNNEDVHQTLARLAYSPVEGFILQAEYQWNMEAIKEKDDDRFQLIALITF